MKITASRRSDLIQQRQADLDAHNAAQAIQDEQEKKYRIDQKAITDSLEEQVHSQIDSIYPGLQVQFSLGFGHMKDGHYINNLDARIDNDPERHIGSKNDGKTALYWSYEIKLDGDGNVIQESNSWSGLNACTKAQLAQLRRTADVIDKIQDLDWATMLNTALPEYRDYVTQEVPNFDDRQYNKDIVEAQIEEIMGTNQWAKGLSVGATGYRDGISGWYHFVGETSSFYKVNFIPDSYLARTDRDLSYYLDREPVRVKKDLLFGSLEKEKDESGVSSLVLREA